MICKKETNKIKQKATSMWTKIYTRKRNLEERGSMWGVVGNFKMSINLQQAKRHHWVTSHRRHYRKKKI